MADNTVPDPASQARLLTLTAQIVSAQVGHSEVAADELPGLIRAVHQALGALGQTVAAPEPERQQPAVPLRRSVQHDAITCLVCGARFRALKRHLAADHDMTPSEYRAHWGLPASYPMVAPDYAAARSRLAKEAGLGRKRKAEVDGEAEPDEAVTVPEPEPEPEEAAPPPKRRGRRAKAAATG